MNGSERIKARCASDSNVEVIESKLSHGSAVRSSAWLDVTRDHALKGERDKDPEVVQSYSGVVESSAEYGNG